MDIKHLSIYLDLRKSFNDILIGQVLYKSFTFRCRSITVLLNSLLRIFSFDAIANESVVLTLDCSLLMYTSSIDIYIIDPVSLTLLSLFIGSNIFQ